MYKLFVVLKPNKSKDADSEGDIGAGMSGYDLISLIIKAATVFLGNSFALRWSIPGAGDVHISKKE